MKTLTAVALSASLLLACDGPEEPQQLEHRFTLRPIRIAASSALPDECVEALDGVTRYLGSFGATAFLVVVDGLVEGELATAGTIAVLPGTPSMRPGQIAHGETRLALTLGENIVGAEVILATCDPHAVTHEVLHGLGATHVSIVGNLMHPELSLAGWTLTSAQIAWVRD